VVGVDEAATDVLVAVAAAVGVAEAGTGVLVDVAGGVADGVGVSASACSFGPIGSDGLACSPGVEGSPGMPCLAGIARATSAARRSAPRLDEPANEIRTALRTNARRVSRRARTHCVLVLTRTDVTSARTTRDLADRCA
jgi:hypothetical protein